MSAFETGSRGTDVADEVMVTASGVNVSLPGARVYLLPPGYPPRIFKFIPRIAINVSLAANFSNNCNPSD
jgi:hypothetical protein